MKKGITLVSINVERRKHLELVEKFLAAQKPDIVCLQEVTDADIRRFAATLNAKEPLFTPMTREIEGDGSEVIQGLGIVSRLPIANSQRHYYAGEASRLPDTISGRPETFTNQNRLLMFADIDGGAEMFRIGTTHFTWSPGGAATDLQRSDMKTLLAILAGAGECVLAGDLNAPRGGEIFGMLAEKYKDNIPAGYKTSLDISLHRAGKLRPDELKNKVVDGIFSTPEYIVSDVRLESGVSDHMAVIATVNRP